MNYYRVPDLPEWLRRAMPPERSGERYERPVSQIDFLSLTLLHDAAAKGSSVVVGALLRSGANPMPAVLRCPPPLFTALDVAMKEGKVEMARFLLERGGAPYARVPGLLEQCPEDVRGEMASVLLE